MLTAEELASINVEGWNMDSSYQQLTPKLYSKVRPAPVTAPKLVLFNRLLAEELGLIVTAGKNPTGSAIFSGNMILSGVEPIAQAYAGHQFGYFTTLGDGRAVLLGEQITPDQQRFDIQLKGSGRTPYSRRGDGRAALGPMLREYLISEAMYALGIPSTRALAVATTGEEVIRETKIPGAVLTRVAASHIRVGTFEYIRRFGNEKELKELADYTIERHYSNEAAEDNSNRYLKLFEAVADKQAALMAKWQGVGFVHGVMNTDNMALSGETIDYGPCAFMDTYHPQTVFSSIDHTGRYAYENQPKIAAWNLARFAETLLPLIHPEPPSAVRLLERSLQEFEEKYRKYRLNMMGNKIGLFQVSNEDQALINELLHIMQTDKLDYTNTFVALSYKEAEGLEPLNNKNLAPWIKKWQKRLSAQSETPEESEGLMKKSNPVIIPRNHQVEKALDAAVMHQDYRELYKLLSVLKRPYVYDKKAKTYQQPPDPSQKPYVTYCGT